MAIEGTSPINRGAPSGGARVSPQIPKANSHFGNQKNVSQPTQEQENFLDSVKYFFKPVLSFLSLLVGVNNLDNAHYNELVQELNICAPASKEEDPLIQRAKYLLKKSNEIILLAEANVKNNRDPWTDLTSDKGVPMSGKLQFLGGDDLSREIFYHNIAVYNWALSELRRFDNVNIDDLKEIKDIDLIRKRIKGIDSHVDLDNTTSSKPDPADTVFYQSEEKQFWLKQLLKLENELKVHEIGNTARTGLVTTKTTLVPEALLKTRTPGSLPSYFLERAGYTLESQFEASDNFSIIGLNGTFIGKAGEKTKLDPVLIEGILLYQLSSLPSAPKVNGKTFNETLLDIVLQEGFAIFEPKALPRLSIDSELSIDKSYLPHYQKIIILKQQCVDKKLESLRSQGKKITDDDIRAAWLDFQAEVKKSTGQGDAVNKDNVWLPGAEGSLSEGPIKLCNLLEEYLPELTIQRSRFLGLVNYKNLLDKNPQAFFEVLTQGVGAAFVAHYFNNHGTPVKGAPDRLIQIFEKFGQDPKFRRMLSALSCALDKAFDGKYSRANFIGFKEKGIKIYAEQGSKEYLDWRINNYFEQHCTKESLAKANSSTGNSIFECGKDEPTFSLHFQEEGNKVYRDKGLAGYIEWLRKEFEHAGGQIQKAIPIIETFLPYENKCTVNDFDSNNIEARKNIALDNEFIFYPNEFYEVNSSRPYSDLRRYAGRRNIVDKRVINGQSNELNPDAQYYEEDQPNSLKFKALPSFDEAIKSQTLVHVAGDSEGDVDMMAKALELGGFVDIVFTQFQDRRLFKEIIKQRLEYGKKVFIGNDDYYQKGCREFGIYALEKIGDKYRKVESFDRNKNPQLSPKEYTEDEIIQEIENKYRFKIIRNASPEARIRRQTEVFRFLAGRNKPEDEFNSSDLSKAEEIYKRKQNGEPINSPKEKELLSLYEYSVVRKFEGTKFPDDAPHFNTYVEWHGKDISGNFIVYKSKQCGGKLVIDRNNGTEPTLYEQDEKSLGELHKVQININNNGDYACLDENGNEELYSKGLEKLNDHELESRLLPEPSPPSGIFANKLLTKILGEKNLKRLVCNMPNMFQGLLRYSGLIMGAGGALRLLSPLTFGLKDSVYNTGYFVSNSVRAISALGGALRGVLNVNRYWNIAIGEALNVVASFLNDGSKHALLGLGNFVLFLGRGQQAAQRRQRVNDHPEQLLKTDQKSKGFKEQLANFVDPRIFVRKVTELSTGLITKVRDEVTRNGLRPLIGEIFGSVVSAAITPIQMVKDVVKDPRLILQIVKRQSEKSGGLYKAVPSPGHLMTLVGAISGISTLISGTFGRAEKFGEVAESGFNSIGRWAISAACGIPAIGIIANAKEIMANPDGLPKIYRGLNGKDVTYNPKAAGILQMIAGLGFGVSSLFDLSKKYVAPLYDISNMLYFAGAAHEEGPNMHKTSLSELRASNKLYDPKLDLGSKLVDFSKVN